MLLLIIMTILIMTSLLSSNLPFNIILFLISMTIICSMKMYMISNLPWLMLITMLLFIGGLMIIYIFIMSMNSNTPMKEKYSLMITIPLFISPILFSSNSNPNLKFTGSLMFSSSWWYLLIMMSTILICMMLMSKIIIHPMKPSKKMK